MGVAEGVLVLLFLAVGGAIAYSTVKRRAPAGARTVPPAPASDDADAVGAPALAGAQAPAGTNGLAITSFVTVVLGGLLAFFITPIFLPIAAVVALVLGYRALREIDLSGGRQGGRGLALGAVMLGWLGVVGGIIAAVLVYYLLDHAEDEEPFGLAFRMLAVLPKLLGQS